MSLTSAKTLSNESDREDQVLYHYCSNKALCSIIQGKSIYLSSLALSNDTSEGRLVTELVEKISQEEGFPKSKQEKLMNSIISEEYVDGLGFCLSTENDLLSQWRAYASNGGGVAIGFSKRSLSSLSEYYKSLKQDSYSLQKVIYDTNTQKNILRNECIKIVKKMSNIAMSDTFRGVFDTRSQQQIDNAKKEYFSEMHRLFVDGLSFLQHIFSMKNEAFYEEQEYRLVSFLLKESDTNCMFKSSKNKITPYRMFSFKPDMSPIRSITLGPKNQTPIHVIKNMLEKEKYKEVEINLSKASYR